MVSADMSAADFLSVFQAVTHPTTATTSLTGSIHPGTATVIRVTAMVMVATLMAMVMVVVVTATAVGIIQTAAKVTTGVQGEVTIVTRVTTAMTAMTAIIATAIIATATIATTTIVEIAVIVAEIRVIVALEMVKIMPGRVVRR